jgi:flagellar hook-length control protein FliK
MRADSLFTPLQGGSASEAGTRSTGRAGATADGMEAFAGLVSQAQIAETRPATVARPARPDASAQSDTPGVPEGEPAAGDSASAKATGVKDDTGPQILPHNPPTTGKEGAGPQILPGEDGKVPDERPPVLPHNPPVVGTSGKEGAGPQVLPGEDGKLPSDERPPVLPHIPPTTGKEGTGPEVLPGEQPPLGKGKGSHLPQINPGPSSETPAAARDGEAKASPVPVNATPQGASEVLTEGQAAAPLAPALVRRLLATHEARDNAAARGSGSTNDLGSRLKARLTGDAAPSAFQATGTPAPSAIQSSLQALSIAATGQTGQAADDLAAAAPPPAGGETPAPATGEASTADPFKAALASVDRGLGLSTLSRATVETTALIAAQIQNRLSGRSTRFEMALTPEGLGRVDVSIEIDSDGRMAARLAFDNPAAATELRGRADELRRQLEQAGLHLNGDALQFTERDPSSADRGFSGFDRRAFARASDLNDRADQAAPEPATWQSLSLTRDRVDLKV